jgi:hypothetical protein
MDPISVSIDVALWLKLLVSVRRSRFLVVFLSTFRAVPLHAMEALGGEEV